MAEYFTLIGQTVVPAAGLLEWAIWFETADRRVQLTRVGPFQVSTVFLGLDHSFHRMTCPEAPPILFETMVFLGHASGQTYRCSTWLQAERQHRAGILYARSMWRRPREVAELAREHLTFWMMEWDRRFFGRYGKSPFDETLRELRAGGPLPPLPV